MTKLHLQLILHPYLWSMKGSRISFESAVPDDAFLWCEKDLQNCALQTTREVRHSQVFVDYNRFRPINVAMHFKTKGICNKGQGCSWEIMIKHIFAYLHNFVVQK